MTDAKPKKKRNRLAHFLCIMLAAAIIIAVIGFVGKDNAMTTNIRLTVDLDAQKEKVEALSAELEAANQAVAELEAKVKELEATPNPSTP